MRVRDAWRTPDSLLGPPLSGRIMRQSPGVQLSAVARTPGCRLDTASLWALLQIYRHGQVVDTATLSGIAVQLQGSPQN